MRSVSSLPSLTTLRLANNEIGKAGAGALSSLTNLTSLDLANNPLGDEGARALGSLTNLTSLDLTNNRVGDEGARALGLLTNLTSLNLFYNQVGAEGARALSSLTNLTWLNLFYNQVGDEGARALSWLTNLTWLNLFYNQVGDEGARALGSLTNLTSLTLDSNQVGDEGARALGSLTNLTSLDLNSNQVGDEGARALGSLTNLTSLDLNNNQVGDEGARALAALTNLTSLDLRGNAITESRTFAAAPSHLRLFLRDNPVTDIPLVLLGNSSDGCVQAYWRDMARGDVLNTAVKVLLVGNGYVGKTTLAYCLKWGEPPKEGETERTHAIELQKIKLDLPRGGTVEVRLWDFGGQERYHAMHRLFVHGGAMYMLLWAEETDAPTDEERHPVSYWLDMIANGSGESEHGSREAEVLLVKNQIDRSDKQGRPADLEGRDLGHLPQPRVSAAKGWQIDELKLYLAKMVEKARPRWHYKIPESWQKVRETLEAWRKSGANGGKPLRTISLGRFEQLCAARGVTSSAVLLGFLHDTSEVYHRAGRFGDSVILDQSWFIDKIYRLFDKSSGVYKSAIAQGGEIRGAVFRTYWPEDDEIDCETYFYFMLQTGMAFELNHDYAKPFAERVMVVPGLLPERGAARLSHVLDPWDEVTSGESWFRFEYAFLHRGQIERIIVALSELSEGRDWWRDGLLVKDPETGCSLVLNAMPRERHLDVRLRKGRQEEAFARVRGALEKILGQPPKRTLVSDDGKTFVDLQVLDELRAEDTHVVTAAGRSVERKRYEDRFARFARPPQPEQDLVSEKLPPKPTRIFISCSNTERDRTFLVELEKRLRALKRQLSIEFWHNRQILAGALVADEIYRRLEVADIVLLLISPDFTDSDDCFSNEMTHALKKYQEKRSTPVPILIRPEATWDAHEIGRHQALPKNGQAVSLWENEDMAWADVSEGLRSLLEEVRAR